MKEEQYKAKVKKHVRAAACKNLLQMKEKHSKMDGLEYSKLELQEYMQSPLFTCEGTNMLVALRTRTVRGIRDDLKYHHAGFSLGKYMLCCPNG